MLPDKNESLSATSSVLSSGWLELSARVRHRCEDVQLDAVGTPIAYKLSLLAADANRMCDHVERLHREAHRLISEYSAMALEVEAHASNGEPETVQRASVEIQREQHRQSASAVDVLKAMFLWVDTPEERVREHDKAAATQAVNREADHRTPEA